MTFYSSFARFNVMETTADEEQRSQQRLSGRVGCAKWTDSVDSISYPR
jgi:hypothetical protein